VFKKMLRRLTVRCEERRETDAWLEWLAEDLTEEEFEEGRRRWRDSDET
jgi:hypothetical protein